MKITEFNGITRIRSTNIYRFHLDGFYYLSPNHHMSIPTARSIEEILESDDGLTDRRNILIWRKKGSN